MKTQKGKESAVALERETLKKYEKPQIVAESKLESFAMNCFGAPIGPTPCSEYVGDPPRGS